MEGGRGGGREGGRESGRGREGESKAQFWGGCTSWKKVNWSDLSECWQVRTLKEGHSAHVTSVAFSFDGKQIVSGAGDSLGIIWNAETGAKV